MTNKTRDDLALEYRIESNFPDFDICHDMGFTKKYEIWEVGDKIERAFCDGWDAAEKQYLGELALAKADANQADKRMKNWRDGYANISKRLKESQSEIESLKAVLASAVDALEFYAHSGHVRRETIRGRIIEYDVDSGPLYEHYEQHVQSEFPPGKKAQKALSTLKTKLGGEK